MLGINHQNTNRICLTAQLWSATYSWRPQPLATWRKIDPPESLPGGISREICGGLLKLTPMVISGYHGLSGLIFIYRHRFSPEIWPREYGDDGFPV